MEELTPEQAGALHALKAMRGPCPSAATLIAYQALGESDRPAHAAHDHLVLCSRCQLVLVHLDEPGAVATPSALRWLLPLAAVAILAIGATLFLPDRTANVPPDTIRGSGILITAPIGTVDAGVEFSWQSPIQPDRYRVTVVRGSDRVWRTETPALRAAPPAGVLETGVEYSWQVEAIDREGDVRMTSPPRRFTIK